MDHRLFTAQEDRIIKSLYEQQGIKKWSTVAKILAHECGSERRARQCQERYQKHLDPLVSVGWNAEEERNLYRLHDQIGNKWAIIAQKFPGRTDNHVKNHFYSKMRKAIRHLNKVIRKNFYKEFKQLKMAVIYKIIEALEDRFKQNTPVTEQIINKCINLKYRLLEYADLSQQAAITDLLRSYELIKEILFFDRNYRKKTKRERRNSNQGTDSLKIPDYEKIMKPSSDYEASSSEYSQKHSYLDEESENSQGKPLVIIQQDIRESNTSKYSNKKINQEPIVHREPQEIAIRGSGESANSVEQLLRGKGALQFYHPEPNLRSYFSYQSNQHSESERADMFGDQIKISGQFNHMMDIEEESFVEESIFRSQR